MKSLTLLLAIAASACTSASAPNRQATAPVPVATATAAMRRVPRAFEVGGVVRARNTAMLASRITAPVLTMRVAAGDRVRAGQPLVLLDSRELDANHARMSAEVAAVERAHAAAIADCVAAEAALTLAQTSHRRIGALLEAGAATPQQLDEAVSALHVAQAGLDAAEAHAAAAAASLEGARQAETAARATASYATLAAPFDGVITERLVDPGALATPGAPLLRIDDTHRFRLEVIVDESRLTAVTEGAPVDVLLDDDESEGRSPVSFTGAVAEIARAVDASSHSFLVKVDLPTQADVRSGMFARARFAAGEQELLMIPARAIVPQGQLSTIFVVSPDQRAQMRVVDTGIRHADWLEVLAGASPGEQVIVSPAGVRDGVAVRRQ